MFTFRPRRHWCFLAEIVDFATLLRLQIELKDVDGREVPLFFYTHGRGSELPPALVQKGHTVAVLYAQRHAFAFSPPGIRHEDPQMIKVGIRLSYQIRLPTLFANQVWTVTQIFPMSLHELLELNDRVRQFSAKKLDGVRTCHGCGKAKEADHVKRCAKCSSFWYCDRVREFN